MKLAIDIGSNTIKCLLGEFRGGKVETFYEKSLESRISGGNVLVGNAADLIIGALRCFLRDSSKLFPEFSVDAVATSALRDAANSSEICGKVFDATSIKIRILSGKEEAELSYRGAMSDPAVNGNLSNLFFDLGGGSMEVVCGENGRVVSSESFKIGAVRMTRKFLASGISNANLAEIKKFALGEFEKKLKIARIDSLVGAGGAVAAARIMKRSMNFTSPENILSLAEFKYMLDLLLNMQAKDVALKFGISQSRAEIVPAAFACVIGLLEFLGADSFVHTFRNLRYGLIMDDFRL